MSSYGKKAIISKVAPWISKWGLPQLFQPFYGGIGHILTFHRVIPKSNQPRIHNHLSLEITPEHLEATILFFKEKKYKFYSLDEVHSSLQQDIHEKFVAFTFDDGYIDNYDYAFPILKKHQVPFTIYVTNCFPNQTAFLWWYHLEDLVLKNEVIEFKWKGKDYNFNTKNQKEKELAFDQIRKLINSLFTPMLNHDVNYSSQRLEDEHTKVQPWREREELMATIFGKNIPSLNLSMTWKQIQEISNHPLGNIGAHTMNHFPLRQLNEKDLQYEISSSKKELEENLGCAIEHFAYPFGKALEADRREFEIIKQLGFKTATTTRIGNIFPQHKNHLECIPRISINEVTKHSVLHLQTSGLLPFVVNKGKKNHYPLKLINDEPNQ